MTEFYVIDYDEYVWEEYEQIPTGKRIFYPSSSANNVDPHDIKFAKLFPTIRSAKSAAQWAGPNVKYHKVRHHIEIIEEVDI
jgi:hypothetical protein